MKKIVGILLVLCLFHSVGQVNALTISLQPHSTTISRGENVLIDLNISDFWSFPFNEKLGGFFIDISYDDSLFSFNEAIFGPFLGDISQSQADAFADGFTPGILHVDETSWLTEWELRLLQPVSQFTLATLSFTGVSVGTGALVLDFVDLSSARGFWLQADVIANTQVTVEPVPEPTTMLLFGAGIAGLGFFRKRKSSQCAA